MSTKMKKGILKPFRYFSNIMDAKDQEMQIGFPTDVKHVAHIGWDGPASSSPATDGAPPTWMKDYHSAPLDSASFRSDRAGSPASNPWASQEIVLDPGGLGETSFKDNKNEAGGTDIAGGDSPPSPNTRRSRRNRSRDPAATSSMDCTGGDTTEKKERGEKSKKGIRKNRRKEKEKEKEKEKTAEDTSGSTCQDLPAVPKKSTRRKNKGGSGASGGGGGGGSSTAGKDAGTTPEEEGTAPAATAAEVEDEKKVSEP